MNAARLMAAISASNPLVELDIAMLGKTNVQYIRNPARFASFMNAPP